MPCPDPDALALAAGGSGDASQREAVLDHAAGCEECHAALLVLALTAISGPLAPAAARSPVGDTVDRYRLGAELGRGAMGVVYAARSEARALAQVHHANVVMVHAAWEDLGAFYLAME